MKQKLSLLILFLFINICNSQNLNLKFLEQLSTISFWDIDDVMIMGYGFKKIEEQKEGIRKYAKITNNDVNNFISITIINPPKLSRNILNLTVGPNYSIVKIKDDLIEDGYLYNGETELGFLIYQKEKVYFLIEKEPNSKGARQIILMENQN